MSAAAERTGEGGRQRRTGPAPHGARRWALVAAGAMVAALVIAAPWWGPRALASLSFFRVRKVQVEGVRYLAARDVVAQLALDSTASVWDDLRPLGRRVAAHPQVAQVELARKLPSTLVVRVVENLPAAFVPGPGGALRAVDARGHPLPIDPSKVTVDLPVVAQRDAQSDTVLLGLLDALREAEPRLYARVSEARRAGKGELLLQLTASPDVAPGGALPVRAMADVTVSRLTEIYPVEDDLARRRLRAAEIDLRYRDQVIARLQ